MEACVKEAIWKFWTDRSLINSAQFGFVQNSSCTVQLLKFMEDLPFARDHKNINVVYIDFSTAFTAVPHGCLMNKLSPLGIKGKFYL